MQYLLFLLCLSVDNLTMKKGIMSLEVVVGFVILLVVASVIIGLVFVSINPDPLPNEEIRLMQNNFKNHCASLCHDSDSIDYCRNYFIDTEQGKDWTGNGISEETLSIGEAITWDACEDRLYCFLVVPCDRFGENPAQGCASALCAAYLTKHLGDPIAANAEVFDKVKPGSCTLPEDSISNWFIRFFPPTVCG